MPLGASEAVVKIYSFPIDETRHPAQGLSRPVDFYDFRAGYLGCLHRLDLSFTYVSFRSLDDVYCAGQL